MLTIARQDQRGGATFHRDADAVPERCRHPLLPFFVDADLNRKVGYHAPVPVRITSERSKDRSDACRQRAATLPSQEWLAGNRYQLLGRSEPE